MTGIGIGAALGGMRTIMTHQRLDFFLLAMDQLVNSAAKWHYMFGSQISVPITIRLIVGRGWGQGPIHSQNLQAWFAHVPGLKVVMPTTPADAKGLLLSSIFDPNPVVFLEHRWLHQSVGEVEKGDIRVPIGSNFAFNKTAAFASNLIKDPSERRTPFAVLTTTALYMSPFFTRPLGAADLTVTLMMSPMLAYRLLEPPKTLIHITSLAPVLSATCSLLSV